MRKKRSAHDAWTATVRRALDDDALEAARAKARQRESIQALGVDPNLITSNRRKVLEFVRDEGTVVPKDVARQFYGGRNVRTAYATFAALTNLGLLSPLRTAEFKLSPLGKQVLGC